VLDAENVYWPNWDSGQVQTGSKAAGGQVTTLASAQSGPDGIAVDDLYVYWPNGGTGEIRRIAKAGGNPQTLVSNESAPVSIAVDSAAAFWVATTTGVVRKVNKGGGSYAYDVSTGPAGSEETAIGLDATYVYWSAGGASGQVLRALKTGGGAYPLATGQLYPGRLAVDDAGIYWVNKGGGEVSKMRKDGTELRVLADGFDYPSAIAVDATTVYWTVRNSGQIMKMPK